LDRFPGACQGAEEGSDVGDEKVRGSYDLVALVVGMLDVDFDVESPHELAGHFRKLSHRFADAGTP